MSTQPPIVIEDTNLSRAWAKVFLQVAPEGVNLRQPVLVSIACTDSAPQEDSGIRHALDEHLALLDKTRVDATALTIFPFKAWVRQGKPVYKDFRDYCVNRLLPRLKSLDSRNRLGTYFERMMAYSGVSGGAQREVDQLEWMCDLLRRDRRSRESALQITCFDPAKDHTGQPVRGFPCLQQIGFSYGEDSSFALHAFYPTQYIFDRAYGNYLGLCQLGSFVAHETELSFARLNCFVGKAERGTPRKRDLLPLVTACRESLDQKSTQT